MEEGRKIAAVFFLQEMLFFKKEPTSICLTQHNSFVAGSLVGCDVDQIERKESKPMFLPKPRG